MARYAYAVKVKRASTYYRTPANWVVTCGGCGGCGGDSGWWTWSTASFFAQHHAAHCEDLHWSNAATICPACQRYGLVAPACPVCLGYGHLPERTDR